MADEPPSDDDCELARLIADLEAYLRLHVQHRSKVLRLNSDQHRSLRAPREQ